MIFIALLLWQKSVGRSWFGSRSLASLDVTSTGWIVASVSGWTDLALAEGSGEVNKKLEDDRRERGRIPHLCPVSKELFSVQCGSVMFIWVCAEIKAHLDTPFPKIPVQHIMFEDSLYILRKVFPPNLANIKNNLSKKFPCLSISSRHGNIMRK